MRKYVISIEVGLVAVIIACVIYLIYISIDKQEIEPSQVETLTKAENESRVDTEKVKYTTAREVVNGIVVGWNLGNTLECYDNRSYSDITQKGEEKAIYYETCWGTPYTQEHIIDTVYQMGFNAVRIPITYRNHMDKHGVIDIEWLQRIQEIVDWVIERDMYCIINLHHDTGTKGWLMAEEDNFDVNNTLFSKIWTQISDYFQDYDEHLIFEGFNELINEEGQWESSDQASYQIANKYNQIFVDTIRRGNGYNPQRCLLLNTYAANSSQETLSAFVLPKDTVDDRLIVSVHCYKGTEGFYIAIKRLSELFVSNNIPVIIGEMGMTNQVGREQYIANILSKATEYHIPCFLWDDAIHVITPEEVYNYALINRDTGEWYFEDLMKIIMENVNGNNE